MPSSKKRTRKPRIQSSSSSRCVVSAASAECREAIQSHMEVEDCEIVDRDQQEYNAVEGVVVVYPSRDSDGIQQMDKLSRAFEDVLQIQSSDAKHATTRQPTESLEDYGHTESREDAGYLLYSESKEDSGIASELVEDSCHDYREGEMYEKEVSAVPHERENTKRSDAAQANTALSREYEALRGEHRATLQLLGEREDQDNGQNFFALCSYSSDMLTRKPYHGPHKLVLAFDVGTTYSGISYCILRPGEVPKIQGVTRFPGQAEGHGSAKVPSILYYDTSGNVKAVGYEALSMNTMDDAEEHGWEKAEWWKLYLRPKHLASAHINDDDLPPLPSGKSAVDILTDFIKYLFQSARTHIQEHHMGLDWTSIENSIGFIFSHPNGWEGAQQQKYREAIEGAGLIPCTREGRSQVHMVTEGEATLHCCISALPEELAGSEPQAIVIIDAGGGTIDLSAYSVAFNPIVCEEIAPAECRLQGSVFVTRRASTLLKRKLEGSPHCSNEEIEDLTREFGETTKLNTHSPDEAAYLTIGGLRYNNPQFNIKRGALRLSGEEATSLFDESIKAIIDAFDQQRKAFNTRPAMVFIVGGLGANNFVWSRLQSHFREQGIDVCRPDNDINKAVANGAVIFHIDRAVKSRVARATYGVPYTPWVDESDPEHRRRRHQWRKSASGHYLVDGGFCPILLKGDQVDEEKEIRYSFCFMNRHQAEFGGEQVNITCYRGELPHPRWLDEDSSSFAGLGTIQANLSKVANNQVARWGISGETYYQVDFDVVVFFGSTELTAQMAWKHNGIEERTPATIVYYDN